MKFLFIFLDGVGLGADDPQNNPFASLELPFLQSLLDGRRLLASSAPVDSERASLRSLDANLGVTGPPQSATGQATLLTGRNIPAAIGYHYGPKPNPDVTAQIELGSLFTTLTGQGKQAALLNAYPPRYFDSIQSGRRLYSAIPLAVARAGIPFKTHLDLYDGQALSADFTGKGWRTQLGYADAPVLEPFQAGQRLAELTEKLDFAFFEYWASDYAGHYQDFDLANSLLQTLDGVLEGLLKAWDDRAGLILITSDHGNLEDLSTRRHTDNPVPGLVIGAPELRQDFTAGLMSLADVAPAILRLLLPTS